MRRIFEIYFDMRLLWSKMIQLDKEIHDIYADNIEWPQQALAFLWCIKCMKKKTPTSVLLLLSVIYHLAKCQFYLSQFVFSLVHIFFNCISWVWRMNDYFKWGLNRLSIRSRSDRGWDYDCSVFCRGTCRLQPYKNERHFVKQMIWTFQESISLKNGAIQIYKCFMRAQLFIERSAKIKI